MTLKELLFKHKKEQLAIVMMIAVMTLARTGTSMTLVYTLNAIIASDVNEFIKWTVLDILGWLIFLGLYAYSDVYMERTMQDMRITVRNHIVENISRANYNEVKQKELSEYLSWFSVDLDVVMDKGLTSFYALINSVFTVLFTTIAMFTLHWVLVVVTFLTLVFVSVVPNLFSKRMKDSTEVMSGKTEQFMSKLQDVLEGYEVFYAYNIFEQLKQRIMGISTELKKAKVEYKTTEAVANLATNLVSVLGQIILHIVTAVLIFMGQATIGTVSSVGNLAGMITNSVASASVKLFQLKSMTTYFEKFDKLASDEVLKSQQLKLNHQLELTDITLRIQDKPIIEHINFTIQKGGKYAIVGSSGSGKSTILDFLAGRNTDYTGQIKVDGKELLPSEVVLMRDITSYTTQRSHIFMDSIGNNISLWNATMQIDDLMSALGIDEFGNKDELLANSGKKISGGQRQRVALARSLMYRDRILLLDESTANLDVESAKKIEQFILTNKELTVVMVTHHVYEESRELFDNVLDLDALKKQVSE